jgi:6-pyruvoyltetrahydropterin/6-carboxytetrahydropterin synthase
MKPSRIVNTSNAVFFSYLQLDNLQQSSFQNLHFFNKLPPPKRTFSAKISNFAHNFLRLETVYITRREHFNAAHKLWREEWSDEKNEEVFGKCSNKNWHGHNFELFVTVKGEPNPETGFVINLKDLSVIIKELVIEELDHKNLNLDVPFLTGKLASTENLAIEIWKIIDTPIQAAGGQLCKIKLVETENNYVEYFGGKEPF